MEITLASTGKRLPAGSLEPKSIHQQQFDAEQYVAALGLPAHALNQTIEWMLAKAQPPMGCPQRVLVIGVGPGRLEVPFVEALSRRCGTVDADFVDYSRDSLAALGRRLRARLYDRISPSDVHGVGLWHRNRISLHVALDDFETWEPIRRCYDIIIASFVINFFDHWEAGVNKIVDLLQPGGVIFYTEDSGDICFLDNTFETSNVSLLPPLLSPPSESMRFREFWQRYYSWRAQLGFPWHPQPSPSDMALVNTHFAEIASRRGGDMSSVHIGPWLSATLSWEDWLRAVGSHPLFHCLTTVPQIFRTQLATELEHLIHSGFGDHAKATNHFSDPLLTKKPAVSVGHRIYCYQSAPLKSEQHLPLWRA